VVEIAELEDSRCKITVAASSVWMAWRSGVHEARGQLDLEVKLTARAGCLPGPLHDGHRPSFGSGADIESTRRDTSCAADPEARAGCRWVPAGSSNGDGSPIAPANEQMSPDAIGAVVCACGLVILRRVLSGTHEAG
jgi:hypothetical protein